MEVPDGDSLCFVVHSLIVNVLNHTGVTPMKETMIYCIKEFLLEAFELGFRAANTGMKSAFLRFSKITLVKMIHKKTLDTILLKSFDCFSHSNAFMDVLVEKIHGHTALSHDHAEPMWRTTEKKDRKRSEKEEWQAHRSITIRERIIIEGVQW